MKYSNNYNFFLLNQIVVGSTNRGKCLTFFSALNGERFKKIETNTPMSDDQVNDECYKIFNSIENKNHI